MYVSINFFITALFCINYNLIAYYVIQTYIRLKNTQETTFRF